MEEEKKITNHYHLTDLGFGAYMILILVSTFLVALAVGVKNGNPWAIAVAAVLTTLILVGIGFLASEWSRGRAAHHERERSKVERIRELDDTRENLAMMKMMSNAQLAQGRAQTEGWRTVNQQMKAQKLLTSGENGDAEGITFDDSLFNELDEIE